ncbi:MAG TPA: hypothetical protein VJ810_41165, partial [Blastocatellia bacterium]|nr:hypothetical protein [Blastocatellia bacterium]
MKSKPFASLLCAFLLSVPVFTQSGPQGSDQAQTQKTPEAPNLLGPGAKVEKVADGFGFIEGPVWRKEGYLLFTDIPRNRIM